MAIGAQTAEDIKFEIGSAAPLPEELATEIRGRDLTTGLPKGVMLTSEAIREALAEPVQTIIDAIKNTLERTPPELAADVGERGIVLAGGGALLRGFGDKLREEVGLPVQVAESPLTCVAEGAGRSLDELETLDRAAKAQRKSRSRSRR